MKIKWFSYDCRPGAPKPSYGYTSPTSQKVQIREIKDGDAGNMLQFAAMAAIGMKGWTITAKHAGDDVEITLRNGNERTKDIVIATNDQWRLAILKAFHLLGYFPEHLVFKKEYR